MKKGFLIAAVILVVAGTLIFSAAIFVSGFDLSKTSAATYETKTYSPAEGFERIEIRTGEADVTFKPSGNGLARVDCLEHEKVRHTVLVEDGTLKVLVSDERAWYDHLTLFSSRPSVTVYLPSDRFTALTVTTDTGDVSVPAAFTFGNAEIASDTGKVSFDASVDGNLKIKTKTGDVRLEGVRAGLIDLSTSTGKIDGGNVTCEWTFSVKVSTGKTVLTDVTCRSLISTGSTGDLTLKNTTATNDLNLKRDTGDVRFEACDAGQITVVTSTGDVSGTFRSEKTFAVKTSTGKVRVPDSASGGRCGITTSTGDITIDLIRY